jgi:hypothetical protein
VDALLEGELGPDELHESVEGLLVNVHIFHQFQNTFIYVSFSLNTCHTQLVLVILMFLVWAHQCHKKTSYSL